MSSFLTFSTVYFKGKLFIVGNKDIFFNGSPKMSKTIAIFTCIRYIIPISTLQQKRLRGKKMTKLIKIHQNI